MTLSVDGQGILPLRALPWSTANGDLQGICHSALPHDDYRNPLNKNVYWPRGSAEGRSCVNVVVRMGWQLLAD